MKTNGTTPPPEQKKTTTLDTTPSPRTSEDRRAEPTAEAEQAEALLNDPNLLERAEQLIERLGLVGEEINRCLLFLAGVGGHLGQPIHVVVKGESSGGKNTVVRIPLQLLPQERVQFTSGLSTQALAFHKGPIEGVLVIDEAEGQQHAEYAIRQAMSEGRVSRMTVDDMKGVTLEVEVTASIITTTTAPALHAENETRVFNCCIDDSEEQTRQILAKSAKRAEGTVEAVDDNELELWRVALGSLESSEVVIPFAPVLSEKFPSGPVRARRDFGRMLDLIRASALLHQRQRDQDSCDRLLASSDDYRVVYPILQAVLGPSMSGLTDKALQLSDLHEELAAKKPGGWVYRADLEHEALTRKVASKNTVHDWCKRLSNLGIWDGEKDHGRWRHRKIRDPRDEPISLPTPSELAEAADLPIPPNLVGGRTNTSEDSTLQQPPSKKGGEDAGILAPTAGPGLLPPPTDWEAPVTPCQTTSNDSHPSDREALGATPCLWCGAPRAGCGFCTFLSPSVVS